MHVCDHGTTEWFLNYIRSGMDPSKWAKYPLYRTRPARGAMVTDKAASSMDMLMEDFRCHIPRDIGWIPGFIESKGSGGKAVHSRLLATVVLELLFGMCDHNVPDATIYAWRGYARGLRMFYGGSLTTAQLYQAQGYIDAFIRHIVVDLHDGDLLPPNYHLVTHLADSVMQTGDVRRTAL